MSLLIRLRQLDQLGTGGGMCCTGLFQFGPTLVVGCLPLEPPRLCELLFNRGVSHSAIAHYLVSFAVSRAFWCHEESDSCNLTNAARLDSLIRCDLPIHDAM